MKHLLSRRAKLMENAFYFEQDRELVARRHELQHMETTRKGLSEVSGISSRPVLDRLIELGVTPDVLAVLALVPLVEVAWACGHVRKEEKAAILAAADKVRFAKGSIDYAILEQWLTRRPPPKLVSAWEHYVAALCEELSESQREQMKKTLLSHARAVAEAAGGFLGLTSTISPEEQKALDRIERALTPKT